MAARGGWEAGCSTADIRSDEGDTGRGTITLYNIQSLINSGGHT